VARNALSYGGSDSDNPLSAAPWTIPDPSDPTVPMSQGAAVTRAVSDVDQWMEAQRRKSAAMGLWDDKTGLPTRAGLLDAIRQTGTAVALGTGGGEGRRPNYTPGGKYIDQTLLDFLNKDKKVYGQSATADMSGYHRGMDLTRYESIANDFQRVWFKPEERAAADRVLATEPLRQIAIRPDASIEDMARYHTEAGRAYGYPEDDVQRWVAAFRASRQQ